MKKTAAIEVSTASDVAGKMKKPLICFISPLSRPASQRTGIRKKRLIAGTKKAPCKQGTDQHLHKSVISLSDHDVSALKSSAMKTAHAFTKTVKSRRKERASDLNQDQCDNIQESAKTYRSTRKKSSPFSSVASKSPRIQKHQHGMLFISPGKRSRSKSIHGLDGIHRRRTVSLTPEDKKKLSKVIEKRVRKQRKCGKDQNGSTSVGDLSFSTSDHEASFPSNGSFVMEVHGSTESLKHQNQFSRLNRLNKVSDEPTAMITSKKSISMKDAESNLPGVLKKRNKMPFVSPEKRSLFKPKHGSDRISQGRTVSMTIVDMKKFDKAIKSRVKRKINETIDRDAQSLELDISTDNDVSCSSPNKSVGMKVDVRDSLYNPKQDDFLQRIDEMYLESDIKRKKPCMKMSEGSTCSSHRIHKQQKGMSFVSPEKKYRQTASVPSKGKKKIQESINYSGTNMKKHDKINVQTRPDNSSLTPNDYDVSRSSGSPGLEADSFLSGIAYKTKDSTRNLKHDHPRSEDNVDLYVQEPEPTLQNEAVSPKVKQKMEAVTHQFGFEIQRKSGRTPNLNFKILDKMYERRFNPSQRDNQEKKSSDQERSRADLKLKRMAERRFNSTEDCPEAVVNMDTVARIRSFQNGQTNSRSSSPPSIQRCAFARDIIAPESDDMSDSTVDEADRSLLEKEISNFFEGKRGQACLDFRKGAMTFDVTPSCVRQDTTSAGNGPVTSTGQNVQDLDDVVVTDDSSCNTTPNILQEVKDNQTLLKSASPAVQNDASASTEYNFGEHLPIDVDTDEPLNDACTPYQHSTPTGSNHHHEAKPKITSSNSPVPWAAIELNKGMFVMYCHEETAPCILKDLEGYPNIIQRSSLTMTYLSDKSLVKVQGMVLLEEHRLIRPDKVPIKEDKAEKREKRSKT
ncbi:uncharacterized protein LOC121429029, partial [Lytechinus variegatus]|uniref:uncharacterized protein LOC121429029 n=1 Tax=Lytechinus variegatus TaxID=7654 RepID=UPI001BB21A12